MRLPAVLLCAVAGLLTASCLGQGERLREHKATGVSTVPAATAPFAEYVATTTRKLEDAVRTTHPDLTAAERTRLARMRAPFEWPPDPPEWGRQADRCPAEAAAGTRTGILLIHGLTDTPFLMRDVGRHFREKHCFRVRAILLPGHGTAPGDLLEVSYHEWIAAARYGIDSFAGVVDHLYIAGFSTGGTLAVYQALARDEGRPALRGLILFSPAIHVADALAPLANWHKIYSWAVPRGNWIGKLFEEHDDVKYESFAKNAGDQIHLLTQEVAAALRGRQLETPVFIALSQDDATVDSRATIGFFRSITGGSDSKNVLISYTTVPEAIGGRGPIRDRISVYPDEGIIAFSHVAIPVRPDNPHYGRQGAYKSCLEYERDDTGRAAEIETCRTLREARTAAGWDARADNRWCRCLEGRPPADGVRLGETSAAALDALEAASALKGLEPPLVLRRLTFNPDFDGMMAEVDAFVERVRRDPR